MSLIATLFVREGIVMAGDSRLTINTQEQKGDQSIVHLAVGQSDSTYKVFLAPHDIGISTCGAADIQGVPIAGYIESFIAEALTDQLSSVEEVASKLLEHFGAFEPVPATQFHVAGYTRVDGTLEQEVWSVEVAPRQVTRLNVPGQQGASWAGEGDVLARLIQPVAQVDADGNIVATFPSHPIPWQFFTLQDAIDFAVFAIRSTIDVLRFQPRPKSVGGPVDVLVIKPSGATWVQRKELRVDR